LVISRQKFNHFSISIFQGFIFQLTNMASKMRQRYQRYIDAKNLINQLNQKISALSAQLESEKQFKAQYHNLVNMIEKKWSSDAHPDAAAAIGAAITVDSSSAIDQHDRVVDSSDDPQNTDLHLKHLVQIADAERLNRDLNKLLRHAQDKLVTQAKQSVADMEQLVQENVSKIKTLEKAVEQGEGYKVEMDRLAQCVTIARLALKQSSQFGAFLTLFDTIFQTGLPPNDSSSSLSSSSQIIEIIGTTEVTETKHETNEMKLDQTNQDDQTNQTNQTNQDDQTNQTNQTNQNTENHQTEPSSSFSSHVVDQNKAMVDSKSPKQIEADSNVRLFTEIVQEWNNTSRASKFAVIRPLVDIVTRLQKQRQLYRDQRKIVQEEQRCRLNHGKRSNGVTNEIHEWYWWNDNNTWARFAPGIEIKLESYVVELSTSDYDSLSGRSTTYTIGSTVYQLNCNQSRNVPGQLPMHYVQTNMKTGNMRQVQRIKQGESLIKPDTDSSSLFHSLEWALPTTSMFMFSNLPVSIWFRLLQQPQNNEQEQQFSSSVATNSKPVWSTELCQVGEGSAEWMLVQTMLQESVSGKLIGLTRNHQDELLTRYLLELMIHTGTKHRQQPASSGSDSKTTQEDKKRNVATDGNDNNHHYFDEHSNDLDEVEIVGFHGTAYNDPLSVLQKGARMSKAADGVLGRGFYLARKASYCQQSGFACVSNKKVNGKSEKVFSVLLCRAIKGRCKYYARSLAGDPGPSYSSAMTISSGSEIFAAYHPSHIFPMYKLDFIEIPK